MKWQRKEGANAESGVISRAGQLGSGLSSVIGQ